MSQLAYAVGAAALGFLGYQFYQLKTYKNPCEQPGPVPAGKLRICIAGTVCGGPHDARAHKIAAAIASKYPEKYETWFYWTGIDQYFEYVQKRFENVTFPAHLKGHSTHPFVWLESADNSLTPVGGRDRLCEWVNATFPASDAGNAEIRKLADGSVSFTEMFKHHKTMPGSTAQCAKSK